MHGNLDPIARCGACQKYSAAMSQPGNRGHLRKRAKRILHAPPNPNSWDAGLFDALRPGYAYGQRFDHFCQKARTGTPNRSTQCYPSNVVFSSLSALITSLAAVFS